MTSDIAAFVLARAAEREAAARLALTVEPIWHALERPLPWFVAMQQAEACCDTVKLGPALQHLVHHDPARVLREVAAAREIAGRYAEHAEYDNPEESYEHATGRICGLGEAMRLLAAIDHDHPDFDPSWAGVTS